MFISTHNYSFFKKVRDWLDSKKNHQTKENEQAEFFMIKNYLSNGLRTANIERLDETIKNYNSEYQYLFGILKKKADSNTDVEIKEWYPLPNIARKLLETFFAFKIPSKKIFSSQMKEFLKQNQYLDERKKIRIETFLDEKSHASSNAIEDFDFDNFVECKEVVKDIMSLIKQSDESHYKELCKCLKNAN